MNDILDCQFQSSNLFCNRCRFVSPLSNEGVKKFSKLVLLNGLLTSLDEPGVKQENSFKSVTMAFDVSLLRFLPAIPSK